MLYSLLNPCSIMSKTEAEVVCSSVVERYGAPTRATTDDQEFYGDDAPDVELFEALPLLEPRRFVEELCSPNSVAAERVLRQNRSELEALATPPVSIGTKIPEDWQKGQTVKVTGPHGPIEVTPPPESTAGGSITFRLVPPPHYRVEVPPGAEPGRGLLHSLPDGTQIELPIPEGIRPGDIFEVVAPSLMVQVPEGARGGDYVTFLETAEGGQDRWLRAPVPHRLKPGQYFAARLPAPPPSEAAPPDSSWFGSSWGFSGL
ncbi:unnamed protein product [Polarella glacialis]|uniref:Uncharacterized protein n=1 Tax=Polarella glacialis TaxID=89957 RepID=A0A813LFB3_POLGL|nr:unnamed protein product [Polarella glacialis]CAE8725661.1 unnamed protein product [Polarella glacialis]